MNSYNENLHSEIVTSLNNQEIELKKLKGQFDASLLSLYYAEGSRITAAEKLAMASDEYKSFEDISEQAVIDSDVSTNVLQSATKSKELVANTVTNTAVAAANVQIAANAILKLASDTGSIYSIVQAASFGGDIYKQSTEAKTLMDVTAYLAESTSQHSMEASGAIAEVATGILADKATATDAGVKNLLGVTTTDLGTASATVTTANETLAESNKLEKQAEGTIENINSIYYASESAYLLNNEELNLNLLSTAGKDAADNKQIYTVSFNPFTSAFKKPGIETKPYPVNTYYILLVKNSVKKNFSIANAENIINNDEDNNDKKYKKVPAVASSPLYSVPIKLDELKDSDGNPFQLGDDYVVFVYADLSTEYKRIINTFDNYLTAPSPSFVITNLLNAATSITVTPPGPVEKKDPPTPPTNGGKDPATSEDADNQDEVVMTPEAQTLTFDVTQSITTDIEYRCIFLPDDPSLTKGLLTINELKSIKKEQQALQALENKYVSDLDKLEGLLTKEKDNESAIQEELDAIIKIIEGDKAANKKVSTKSKSEKTTKTKALNTSQSEIKKLEEELIALRAKIQAEALDYSHIKHEIPGFCFDLMIAQKIPAGSYTTVTNIKPSLVKTDVVTKGTVNNKASKGSLMLTASMTDNFGNRLVKGKKYIPVILSMSDDTTSIDKTITNILSDFKKTPAFPYQG